MSQEQVTYHFLRNPEEMADIPNNVPKVVIRTHIRSQPRWKVRLYISAFKSVEEGRGRRHFKVGLS